jgi:hypothetical protein
MSENGTEERVKLIPSAPGEQEPLIPLGGEQQQSTETENLYEEMTSYFMLDLLLEGKLPTEAVPIYFQKLKDEEIAVATGALYKRIGFSVPDKSVQRKFEAIANAQHAKLLAEKYNDPQAIERRVKAIEAKYNPLLNNSQEQARYFANQASELSLSSNWKSAENLVNRNTTVANLYGMASRLARQSGEAPKSAAPEGNITAVRTALQTEGKPAA